MKNKILISLIISCILILAFFPINQAQAVSCPLTSQSGRTIVNLYSGQGLLSNSTQDRATNGPFNVSIPSGSYGITLVSYDNHSDKGGQGQLNEAFYLILKNSQGGTIVNTPALSDLPENQDYLTQRVVSNFSINQNVSSITVFHVAYPASGSNSIRSVCAAFDRISTPTPPSYPPYLFIAKSVDGYSASPGEEITYTLNYRNGGQGKATGVVIKDPFTNYNQGYLTFISATPIPDSNNDTWNIGELNPGESSQITIKARISSSLPSGSIEIRNRASIDSNETNLQNSNYASVFVTSRARLNINKLVSNVSQNTSFSQSVNADPGDEIEFSLVITNTGNAAANGVKVWDRLPNNLDYIPNSTTVDDSSDVDVITDQGIIIGNFASGQHKTVKFKAEVASEDKFYIGATILTNYGYVKADNHYSILDTATVRVEKKWTSVAVLTSSGLNIEKLLRNITKNSYQWIDVIYANPNDEIEVLIRVNLVGNEIIKDIKIKDELPSKLTYIPGSTTINNSYHHDGVVSYGIYIGDIRPGITKQIKFKIKVASIDKFKYAITTLVNQAHAIKPSAEKITDTARIKVEKKAGKPVEPIETVTPIPPKEPGEVKGAVYVATGANLIALLFLIIISCFATFIVYCRLRENKVLEDLNNNRGNRLYKALIKFYFKLKSLFPASVKKKTYWETDW